MFSTCIHCNTDLGRNEAFETFPVGQRLAFDARLGRLWAVCRSCARWNLSPLDTRWETIEAAERRFRDSRLRVSSENVGLARLREGVDLIRIGSPQRPEMAAWRYGDQFGTRRKRQLLVSGAVATGASMVVGGFVIAGLAVGSLISILANPGVRDMLFHGWPKATVARILMEDGTLARVQRMHARAAVLERHVEQGTFALSVQTTAGYITATGDEATQILTRLMPTVNRFGGSTREVQDAVGLLERSGSPSQVLHDVQRWSGGSSEVNHEAKRRHRWYHAEPPAQTGTLRALVPRDRLALEMALHEESERRAMDGELAALEAQWRDAEEIANIADGLLVPPDIEQRLQAMKGQSPSDRDP